MSHALLAFLSGVVMEALYALGVVVLSSRRVLAAGGISVVWGAAVLLGVNETFRTHLAAVAWCVGLGIGTIIGAVIGNKLEDKAKK